MAIITPWGKSDHQKSVCRGINWYATPRHGGLSIAKGFAEKNLSVQALSRAIQFGNAYWYEEDELWGIPAYELYDICCIIEEKDKEKYTKAYLLESIGRYHPEYALSVKENKLEKYIPMPALVIGQKIVLDTGAEYAIIENAKSGYIVTDKSNIRYRLKESQVKRIKKILFDEKTIWENKLLS